MASSSQPLPHPAARMRALIAVALAAVVVIALAAGLAFLFPWSSIPYWAVDFTVFYAAASALAHGGNPYLLADLVRYVPPDTINASIMYAYPPLFAQLFIPLTLLPLDSAARLWFMLNFLIPGFSTVLVVSAGGWRPRPLILALLILGAMLFLPCLYTYLSGQASLWLLLWTGLGVFLLSRELSIAGGIAWALAWAKPQPVPLLPLVLLIRHKRALIIFLGIALLSLALAARWLPTWVSTATHMLGVTATADERLYQAPALGVLAYLGPVGTVIRVIVLLAAPVSLVILHRQGFAWKPFTIAQITIGLVATPYISRSDVAIALIPILLILSDRRRENRPAAILAVVAWSIPLLCVLLRVLLGLDWLLLPLAWGSLTQWVLAAAAGVYLWSAECAKRPGVSADSGAASALP